MVWGNELFLDSFLKNRISSNTLSIISDFDNHSIHLRVGLEVYGTNGGFALLFSFFGGFYAMVNSVS